MRERFDAGTGLVAVGAVLLLVSLFIDWYDPGGDAWAVFESLDLVLAGVAVCGLLAVAPRFGAGGLGRALPLITAIAFAIVVVQLLDPPPVVQQLRPRHRRMARPRGDRAHGRRRAAGRREHLGDRRRPRPRAPPAHRRHRRARGRRPGGRGRRRGRGARARPGRRFGRRDEPLLEPREPVVAEPAEDPQRTQALDPVEPAQE